MPRATDAVLRAFTGECSFSSVFRVDHQSNYDGTGHRSAGVLRAVRAVRWAGVVGGLSQSLSGAAGALLARDVAGVDTVAGWPQAALVVGSAVAAVALGWLTRTHGRRIALATGAIAASVGAVVVLVGAGSRSLAVILIGSVLLGAGNTTVMLGRYAAGELATAATRARQMGWVLAATAVGAVLGPGLLGPSGTLDDALGLPPHTGAYVVAAAGYALTSAVLVVGMRELPAGRPVPTDRRLGAGRVGSARRAVRRAGGLRALAVLAVANLVMVTAMTMAPVHLHHQGVHLHGIGLVVGAHIAGMFAPSPVTGWLTDRFGPRPVVAGAGALLTVACLTVALGESSLGVLVIGLTVLGLGWNAALVAGSAWLSAGAASADRSRLEGYGEVGMGVAAGAGAVLSGVVVGALGYSALAAGCALASAVLVPLGLPSRRPTRSVRPSETVAVPRLAEEVVP